MTFVDFVFERLFRRFFFRASAGRTYYEGRPNGVRSNSWTNSPNKSWTSVSAGIEANRATSELKRSLKRSHFKLDKAPNFLQVIANSPASLRVYIHADAALVRGHLTPRQREQAGSPVAEINGCAYSLSAHYDVGKSLGLTHDEMQLARKATAADPRSRRNPCNSLKPAIISALSLWCAGQNLQTSK